jgi:hypothetical protein
MFGTQTHNPAKQDAETGYYPDILVTFSSGSCGCYSNAPVHGELLNWAKIRCFFGF